MSAPAGAGTAGFRWTSRGRGGAAGIQPCPSRGPRPWAGSAQASTVARCSSSGQSSTLSPQTPLHHSPESGWGRKGPTEQTARLASRLFWSSQWEDKGLSLGSHPPERGQLRVYISGPPCPGLSTSLSALPPSTDGTPSPPGLSSTKPCLHLVSLTPTPQSRVPWASAPTPQLWGVLSPRNISCSPNPRKW